MDRRKLIRQYRETPRPMGVFRVLNTVANKCYLGASRDVPSILNRNRAQLRLGAHPDKALQMDWNALGADAFVLETLDTIDPSDAPGYDPREDLRVLEQLWRDRLLADGHRFY